MYVSGDYKSHEVSANVIPFNFKIPFAIEIPDNLVEESITLEISDFAYEMEENSKIKVSIELELFGEEKESEEEEPTPVEVDSDEIVKMLEEASEKEKEEDRKESEEELKDNEEKEIGTNQEEIREKEDLEEETREETNNAMTEEENVIITGASNTIDEYTTYHIHIVKDGETIETICTMYNSNLALLNDYNDLSEVTKGMKLIIPENDES